MVSIAGPIEARKTHGIDPVQAVCGGLHLIERLTEDKRIGKEGDAPMPGTTWRIEAVETGPDAEP